MPVVPVQAASSSFLTDIAIDIYGVHDISPVSYLSALLVYGGRLLFLRWVYFLFLAERYLT